MASTTDDSSSAMRKGKSKSGRKEGRKEGRKRVNVEVQPII